MDTLASALELEVTVDTSASALVPSGLEVTVDHDTSKSELATLEATLSPSELERYNRRLKEGFNLDIDEVYLQWKRLCLKLVGMGVRIQFLLVHTSTHHQVSV